MSSAEIAEVDPESAQRLREFAQHIGDLALRAAFVDVMVPAADVGKCDLHSQVGFDELGELSEAVAETTAWDNLRPAPACTSTGSADFSIFTASKVSWPVPCITVSTELAYMASKVFEDGRRFGFASADAKIVDVVYRDRRFLSGENSWQRRAERDGAEGGLVGGLGQESQTSIQPSVFGGLDAGRAGLHKILRIEVGAAWVGRSGRMHDRQMRLFQIG